jgi:SAM-dependent methyltransferase
MSFSDFRPAPNQGGRPDLYELENRAVDPDGLVLAEMRRLAPWGGQTLVDLGCGSGYWLPGYAAEANEVIGVEPDPALLEAARARDRRVRVLAGSAEHIPLADASVDVVHARFAYFWPPRCQAGLTEVLRVLRPGPGAQLRVRAVRGAAGVSHGSFRRKRICPVVGGGRVTSGLRCAVLGA